MANSTVYALDAGGNKIETLTKEQILAAIQAAVETGQIPETLAAAIESIIEQNTSANIKFWVGTQAQFLELADTEENTLYFITDLTTVKDISDALDTLTQGLNNGTITVKKASEADKATEVTEKINGKNLSDIFDSDGTTAKKATSVKKYCHLINARATSPDNAAGRNNQVTAVIFVITSKSEEYNANSFINDHANIKRFIANGYLKEGEDYHSFSIGWGNFIEQYSSPGKIEYAVVFNSESDVSSNMTYYFFASDFTDFKDTVIPL